MAPRSLVLVSSLVILSGVAAAEDATRSPLLGSGGGVVEVKPGGLQGSGRQVFIQGLIDLDFLNTSNTSDGNSTNSDHRSEGWIRADLGTRVSIDERVEVAVTLGYQGVAGDGRSVDPNNTNPVPNGSSGNAVVNDAYVKLKDFLGYREAGLWLGRQPISWSLRKDHSAFLYDSHADNRTITGWDVARGQFNLDTLDFSPWVGKLPDNSTIYSLVVDWKPENVGDNRVFVTASYNIERDILLRNPADPGSGNPDDLAGPRGKNLRTVYAGLDLDVGDFELFGEGAVQRGDEGNGVSFAGFGVSGGLDWHAPGDVVLGIQGDYLSGDDNPNDSTDHGFINKWEGTSDTFIVESEKYGEISRLLDGNLEALKVKLEYALDDRKRVRLKSVYGNYRIASPSPGQNNKLGQEFDMALSWDYTTSPTTFTLFGGLFFPDEGYRAIPVPVGSGIVRSTDMIYIVGLNLKVKF